MQQETYDDMMAGTAMAQQVGINAENTRQQLLLEERERGLAEEQLDVEEIIDRIENLLRGRIFTDKTGDGVKTWEEPSDNSMKILSEEGVQRIIQIVRFHINKNTLLSNFSEEQINRIMFAFTTELNDLVLLKYKKIFREPTFEECKQIINQRVEERTKLKAYAIELLGAKPDVVKIRSFIVKEIEGRIEREVQRIKDDQLKERIKEYGILTWEIEAAVYSTYNRAYQGKERDTLRKHANFSETRILNPQDQRRPGLFGMFKG